MSWEFKGNAAPIYLCDVSTWASDVSALDHVGDVVVTSTSTMEVQNDYGHTRFRTFSISSSTVASSLASTDESKFFNCAGARPTAASDTCAGERIAYVDSGYRASPFDTWLYDDDLRLVADEHGGTDSCSNTSPVFGNGPATDTSIPAKKRQCTVDREKWSYTYMKLTSLETGVPGVKLHVPLYLEDEDYFAVSYKDPHVVKVPGEDKWLMFLARYRVRESHLPNVDPETGQEILEENCDDCTQTGSLPTGGTVDLGGAPGRSIGDIVLYWSDNPEFEANPGTVEGPFLVVDSLDAVPETFVRFWLGVPGACFASDGGIDYLYLYYMVEPDHTTGNDEGPYVDELSDDPTENRNIYLEIVRSSGLEVSTLHGYLQPGIWVKRIPVGDLLTFLADTTKTDEATWTVADACPGDLLGQVELYAVDPTSIGEFGSLYPGVGTVRRLTEHWSWWAAQRFDGQLLEATVTPRHADPCPVACSGRIALFFSVANSLEDELASQNADPTYISSSSVAVPYVHGIWHGMSVPTGSIVAYERDGVSDAKFATFGKTFVVNMQVDPVTGQYKDQVYRGTTDDLSAANKQYTPSDPDAFFVTNTLFSTPDFRVYFTGLREVEGDYEDGCYEYSSAWDALTSEDDEREKGAKEIVREVHRLLPWLQDVAQAGKLAKESRARGPNDAANETIARALPWLFG
ncbi:MAG: hypothetical protein ACOZNI_37665 [Myxococcota bacterium]